METLTTTKSKIKTSTVVKTIVLAGTFLLVTRLAFALIPPIFTNITYKGASVTCTDSSFKQFKDANCQLASYWTSVANKFCESRPPKFFGKPNKVSRVSLENACTFSRPISSVPVSSPNPLPVQPPVACPTLNPGDMVKPYRLASIYILDSQRKLRYFPDSDVFKSWRSNDDVVGFSVISNECYNTFQFPTVAPYGVNFRPGSYIIKRSSSDLLYAIEPGNKLAKITPAVAATLYGANYQVKIVADVFWPNFIARGPDITTSVPHPGMLLKLATDAKVWYVNENGSVSEVTGGGATANRFRIDFVRTVATSTLAGMTVGAPITGYVPALSDRVQ